jgi:hypothetical protein
MLANLAVVAISCSCCPWVASLSIERSIDPTPNACQPFFDVLGNQTHLSNFTGLHLKLNTLASLKELLAVSASTHIFSHFSGPNYQDAHVKRNSNVVAGMQLSITCQKYLLRVCPTSEFPALPSASVMVLVSDPSCSMHL